MSARLTRARATSSSRTFSPATLNWFILFSQKSVTIEIVVRRVVSVATQKAKVLHEHEARVVLRVENGIAFDNARASAAARRKCCRSRTR